MRKLLIFDCDGTLVDTVKDVAICFNGALEYYGFPTYPIDDYGGIVGGNLETIVTRLLPENARTTENVEKVKTKYRALYSASDKPNTKPFEGIVQRILCASHLVHQKIFARAVRHGIFIGDGFADGLTSRFGKNRYGIVSDNSQAVAI